MCFSRILVHSDEPNVYYENLKEISNNDNSNVLFMTSAVCLSLINIYSRWFIERCSWSWKVEIDKTITRKLIFIAEIAKKMTMKKEIRTGISWWGHKTNTSCWYSGERLTGGSVHRNSITFCSDKLFYKKLNWLSQIKKDTRNIYLAARFYPRYIIISRNIRQK